MPIINGRTTVGSLHFSTWLCWFLLEYNFEQILNVRRHRPIQHRLHHPSLEWPRKKTGSINPTVFKWTVISNKCQVEVIIFPHSDIHWLSLYLFHVVSVARYRKGSRNRKRAKILSSALLFVKLSEQNITIIYWLTKDSEERESMNVSQKCSVTVTDAFRSIGRFTRSWSIEDTSSYVVSICFLLSSLWSVPPLFGRISTYLPKGLGFHCELDWFGRSLPDRTYFLLLFLIVSFLPLILMVYANIYIQRTVHRLTHLCPRVALEITHLTSDDTLRRHVSDSLYGKELRRL